MKKVFLLAAAFFMLTGVVLADKGKKKKCAKGKSCCSKMSKAEKKDCKKSCHGDKEEKTVKL